MFLAIQVLSGVYCAILPFLIPRSILLGARPTAHAEIAVDDVAELALSLELAPSPLPLIAIAVVQEHASCPVHLALLPFAFEDGPIVGLENTHSMAVSLRRKLSEVRALRKGHSV